MEIKKIMPFVFVLMVMILQISLISAQAEETGDLEFLGLELEKLVMFVTGLVALTLFIITFIAYRRDRRSKIFYISIAFLLFAIKSFILSSELFIEQIEWFEPTAIVIELFALLCFFYGVFKR
jgi:fucose 4-O-acetylase-like acetyltransferase